MATPKKGSKKSTSKRSTRPNDDEPELLAAGEPIIITGGSLQIEYPDGANDGFAPDTGDMPGTKRKLKHKKSDADKVELTGVLITNKNGSRVLAEIKLDNLNKHKDCRIIIQYDLK